VRIGRRGLFERKLKGFVIAGAPGDFNAGPLLCYSPFGFQEEMSSVNDFVFSQKIFVRNPLNVVSLNSPIQRRNLEPWQSVMACLVRGDIYTAPFCT
jgi:hypothetical protein